MTRMCIQRRLQVDLTSAGMVLVNLTSMLLMKPQVRPDGGDTKPTCLLCTTGLAGLGG
jgi:hypothetical protein